MMSAHFISTPSQWFFYKPSFYCISRWISFFLIFFNCIILWHSPFFHYKLSGIINGNSTLPKIRELKKDCVCSQTRVDFLFNILWVFPWIKSSWHKETKINCVVNINPRFTLNHQQDFQNKKWEPCSYPWSSKGWEKSGQFSSSLPPRRTRKSVTWWFLSYFKFLRQSTQLSWFRSKINLGLVGNIGSWRLSSKPFLL